MGVTLYPEPQTVMHLSSGSYGYCRQNLNLYNHTGFQMVKQNDTFHVKWVNEDDDDWFHPTLRSFTNADPGFMEYFLELQDNKITHEDICKLNQMTGGYTINFFSPNITYAFLPTVALQTDCKSHATQDVRSFKKCSTYSNEQTAESGVPGDFDRSKYFYSRAIGGGGVSQSTRKNENNSDYELGCYHGQTLQSKCMKTLLPKVPLPRILFKTVPVPENNSVVTWTFHAEYTTTIEYVENTMRAVPLDTSQYLSGWCGSNMFGMRAGASTNEQCRPDNSVNADSRWGKKQSRNQAYTPMDEFSGYYPASYSKNGSNGYTPFDESAQVRDPTGEDSYSRRRFPPSYDFSQDDD